ncbi:galactosyltransferase-domain-containing protein [Halteromyces radiatus]|uniref:galactosyltransferase-domain-containing protein n=1 Tax=Halteromyces radiatus TaxID=101107 RepID=UPI00221FDF1B|nr:galactosyltransferase-domain-containing protein [Halteromyces radiatus]KAI8088650.1 galactosyltransferase-domain-containing protein [Halteromyces radiatus]
MQTSGAPPMFRNKILSSLNVPRRYSIPVILLRALSLIPSLLGFTYNTKATWHVDERDAGGAIYLSNTKANYFVATLWCALAGYWSWILMTSMTRRWLYHYEVNNAIVRLITLTVLNWSTAAFISSKGGSPTKIWMTICFVLLVCNILKLVIANSPKYHRKVEDVSIPRINLKSTAVKVLVLPLLVVTCWTMYVGIQQTNTLLYTTSQLMQHQPYLLDTSVTTSSVLILILSSWTNKAAIRRQILRDTSLQLLNNKNSLSVTYRFVVGQPPSAWAQATMGAALINESNQYHDMLVIPTSDLDIHQSWKLFSALRWSVDIDYDYLVKTIDDVFVRWDRLTDELISQGHQTQYWKGLVYRNMPWNFRNIKKSTNVDYAIPVLPSFTSGTLYTLSKDMVQRIVQHNSTRRYSDNEDENLSFWLFGVDIRPQHDARIQDLENVCEDDLLAKPFTSSPSLMKKMYDNIIQQRPQCTGLKMENCAVCYPCYGKKNDWRDLNFQCDQLKGVSPMKNAYAQIADGVVKDTLPPSVIGENDEWIIDGILSRRTSKYSDGDDWSLVYWVCWTSEPSTFTERHWRALELVWVHEPRAVIFMISNTLPQAFFDDYTKYGYNIQVVHFNKENLLNWQWYFGPGTRDWLSNWENWEKGQFFYWHLTDYIRCLLLYNYGGTYMDMDALWIRLPPDRNMEFIGSDYSSLESDRQWTLDDKGLYLPQGVMRFKRGWKLFREMAESAFSAYTYDPGCFNCGGPKAITTYARQHRSSLENAGFTILPREVLYPSSYLEISNYLLPDPLAEQKLRTDLMTTTWNIHLFGKMTNHLSVQRGSIVDLVLRAFDLDLPHINAKTGKIISSTSSRNVALRLIGPRDYVYRARSSLPSSSSQSLSLESVPGKLQGLNVIYIRGGPPRLAQVTIDLDVVVGKLQIGIPLGEPFMQTSITLTDVTQQHINALLNSIVYLPSSLHVANGGKDLLHVTISYHNGELIKETDKIEVAIFTMEADET